MLVDARRRPAGAPLGPPRIARGRRARRRRRTSSPSARRGVAAQRASRCPRHGRRLVAAAGSAAARAARAAGRTVTVDCDERSSRGPTCSAPEGCCARVTAASSPRTSDGRAPSALGEALTALRGADPALRRARGDERRREREADRPRCAVRASAPAPCCAPPAGRRGALVERTAHAAARSDAAARPRWSRARPARAARRGPRGRRRLRRRALGRRGSHPRGVDDALWQRCRGFLEALCGPCPCAERAAPGADVIAADVELIAPARLAAPRASGSSGSRAGSATELEGVPLGWSHGDFWPDNLIVRGRRARLRPGLGHVRARRAAGARRARPARLRAARRTAGRRSARGLRASCCRSCALLDARARRALPQRRRARRRSRARGAGLGMVGAADCADRSRLPGPSRAPAVAGREPRAAAARGVPGVSASERQRRRAAAPAPAARARESSSRTWSCERSIVVLARDLERALDRAHAGCRGSSRRRSTRARRRRRRRRAATSSPARPPCSAAPTPPTSVATIGSPAAAASKRTCGRPSVNETWRKACAPRYSSRQLGAVGDVAVQPQRRPRDRLRARARRARRRAARRRRRRAASAGRANAARRSRRPAAAGSSRGRGGRRETIRSSSPSQSRASAVSLG